MKELFPQAGEGGGLGSYPVLLLIPSFIQQLSVDDLPVTRYGVKCCVGVDKLLSLSRP